MTATVIELKQVPMEKQEEFAASFRRFLEKEFACGNCFARLELVRHHQQQQQIPS